MNRTNNTGDSIVTVGAFDGVHRGHQEILSRLIKKAEEMNVTSLVVTFWPHPSHIIGHKPLRLINTLDEKKALIEAHGVEKVVVLPFTHEFAKINSLSFIRDYLIDQFKMKYFLLGYNHHFGSDRQGDFNVIKEYGMHYGFDVEKAVPVEINGEKISSTKIRHAISEGNIELANLYLGYNYFITGIVVEGQMLGRTIGFPTANVNIQEEHKLLPKDGVYAVKVEISGKIYSGMLNIGHRPTVNKEKNLKTIEVHILDFNEDIYNQNIKVSFFSRIRDETKFAGIEILKEQLMNDMLRTRQYFSSVF